MYTMSLKGNPSFAHTGTVHDPKAAAAGRFMSRQTVSQPQQESVLVILGFILLLTGVTVSSISGQLPWFVAALAIIGLINIFYPKSTSAGEQG